MATDVEQPLIHICESCELTKVMTPTEAYQDGWDYPPRMGVFGIVSPRTCGSCGVDKTLWWRLTVEHVDPTSLSAAELALLARIEGEPGSLQP